MHRHAVVPAGENAYKLHMLGSQTGVHVMCACTDTNTRAVDSIMAMRTWVVVKIMVPFWVLSILRHLVFRGPKRGP